MTDPDMPLDEAFAATGELRRAALCKLAENIETNRRRQNAGHPPVPCQLSGDETQALSIALASMAVSNLIASMKGGRKG